MRMNRFKELFYIRCPHCGHEVPVVKVKKAEAELDKRLVPGKPSCPQVKNLLACLDLVCEKCGEKGPEIDCRDAHSELEKLLRKKDWLRENERQKLEGYSRIIEYGKALTWNQVKDFEKVQRQVGQRILQVQGKGKATESRPIKYCPVDGPVPVNEIKEGNYIVSRCSICGQVVEKHRA